MNGCPLTAAHAALRDFASGISPKVQLRELVADGIVRRQPTGVVPAPVEYSPTEYGRSVVPIVQTPRRWGRTHLEHHGSPVGDS